MEIVNLSDYKEYEPFEEPVATHIDMWYNPYLKLWELTPMDDDNNQVGNTVYEHGKKDALWMKKEMEKDLSLYSKYY